MSVNRGRERGELPVPPIASPAARPGRAAGQRRVASTAARSRGSQAHKASGPSVVFGGKIRIKVAAASRRWLCASRSSRKERSISPAFGPNPPACAWILCAVWVKRHAERRFPGAAHEPKNGNRDRKRFGCVREEGGREAKGAPHGLGSADSPRLHSSSPVPEIPGFHS